MDTVSRCKLCSGPAKVWGYTDANRTCNNHVGFPWLGVPVRYDRCTQCGLIYTQFFDNWTNKDFSRNIYNQHYHLVDPDYVDSRPRGNAEFLANMIPDKSKTILDYGGGEGKTAQYLKEKGYTAFTYDPFVDWHSTLLDEKFDIVSCIEVFEHVTRPMELFTEVLKFVKPNGKLIFTTLTNDMLQSNEMHWYLSPRNGHILMHSYNSLDYMARQAGVTIEHINNSLHVVTI